MLLAKNIREFYEKCDQDIRKIFYKLTKQSVRGPAFEDLLGAFYLDVWRSNMFRGGFEFGNPEAEACFTPYVYTMCKRFHRNYCQKLFGKKGNKKEGWTCAQSIRDLKGNDVDVFSVAIGANHSTLCSAYTVGTAGGADYLWGDTEPGDQFKFEDFRKTLMRSKTLKSSEKELTMKIVEDLRVGLEMPDITEKMQGTADKSQVYRLRRQARDIMNSYMYGRAETCLK